MGQTIQKRISHFLTVILMLLGTIAAGQNINVTGTVTSGEDQEALIGVSVGVKGTLQG